MSYYEAYIYGFSGRRFAPAPVVTYFLLQEDQSSFITFESGSGSLELEHA